MNGLQRVAFLVVALGASTATAWEIEAPAFTTMKADPTWGVTVRTGPYRPQVAPVGDPRQDFFALQFRRGIRRSAFKHGPLLTSLHVDYYFLNSIGRLGLSANVGYWSVAGYARRCVVDQSVPREDQVVIPCTADTVMTESVRGDTPTLLHSVPLGLEVVYKADQLLKYVNVPLMPYGRAGVVYYFWWTETGGRLATVPQPGPDLQGHGGTVGLQFTGGLAINLDWFSPDPGGGITSLGLVGSHLVGEITYAWADHFGAAPSERLNMSDFTGFIGVTVDFE